MIHIDTRNYIMRLKEKSVNVCNEHEEGLFNLIKEEMGVSRDDVIGKYRGRQVVVARKVLVNLLHNYYDVHEDIASMFINRDRTTAIYYIKCFESDYKYDKLFKKAYDKILFRSNFIQTKNIKPNEYKERLEQENKYLEKEIERYRAKIEELEDTIRKIRGSVAPCVS